MKMLIFLLLIPISSLAQTTVKGRVRDTRGVGLALTNVVSLKGNNGTITNEDGEFELQKLSFSDTLKITNISFIPKLIPVSAMRNNDEIVLIDSIRKLDEVLVRNLTSFKNTLNLGYNLFSSRGEFKLMPGNQIAVYINNPKGKIGWVRSITFGIKSFGKCKNSIRIRLLDVDSISFYPTIDLLSENIILKNNALKKQNTIDLSEFKVVMPRNGIYILLEWIYPEEACEERSYTSISANLETPTNVVWFNYRDKKWGHSMRPRLPNGNFMTPNFGIEVAF